MNILLEDFSASVERDFINQHASMRVYEIGNSVEAFPLPCQKNVIFKCHLTLGYVTCMVKVRNVYKILAVKPKRKRLCGWRVILK